MGACSSTGRQIRSMFGTKSFFEKFPEYASSAADFAQVHITHSDLFRLHKEFVRMDRNKDGKIDFDELLEHLELEPTRFNHRVYLLLNKSKNSHGISFPDFVVSLCLFVRSSRDALEAFAFSLYDADGSGGIETGEMVEMCKDVYGDAFSTNKNARRIVEQVEALNNPSLKLDPIFTMVKFSKFCDRHPGLLYPAFQTQESFRQHIIGRNFWTNVEERIESIEGLKTTIAPSDLALLTKLKSVHQINLNIAKSKSKKNVLENPDHPNQDQDITDDGPEESNVAAEVKQVEKLELFGKKPEFKGRPRARRASIGTTRELPEVASEHRELALGPRGLETAATLKPLDFTLLPKLQAELHAKKKQTTKLPHIKPRSAAVDRNRQRALRARLRRRSIGDERYNPVRKPRRKSISGKSNQRKSSDAKPNSRRPRRVVPEDT